jgi:hypothetical protein
VFERENACLGGYPVSLCTLSFTLYNPGLTRQSEYLHYDGGRMKVKDLSDYHNPAYFHQFGVLYREIYALDRNNVGERSITDALFIDGKHVKRPLCVIQKIRKIIEK